MKNIIKPRQDEEVEIFSDFSGERFMHDIPEVTIKLDFGYGSKFDDSQIEFHLTDEESKDILELIKNRLCDNTKEKMKKETKKAQKDYNDAMDFRDWNDCDYYASKIELHKYFSDGDQISSQKMEVSMV